MKIVVLSDTHSRALPASLKAALFQADLIVHVGDFCSLDDLKEIAAYTEVKAVYGNMDDMSLRNKLPSRDIFDAEGVRIGLFHGKGPAKEVIEYAKEEFSKDKVDIVVFGHSHSPYNEKIGKVLYFNPGSPTDKISAPMCSYGIIEVKDGKYNCEIIEIKD